MIARMMPRTTTCVLLLAISLASLAAAADPKPQKERYLASAQSAGDYLVRMLRDDGSFVYLYDPVIDKPINDYNLLRHCGTIYAMLELYEINRSPELLKSLSKPIDYALKRVADAQLPGIDAAVLVDEENTAKLGGNALLLLMLAKHAKVTGSKDHLPLMRKLAQWMAWAQNPDGEFRVQQKNLQTQRVALTVSPYAPGQAVFAFARLYELDPNKDWLEAAERAAAWLVNVRDGKLPVPSLPHDHWLLYALNDLHRLRPNELWITHVRKMTLAIIHSQHLANNAPKPEWVGGWYVPPRTTPVATRVEGLMAAHFLFRDFDRPQEAAECLASAKLGIEFMLRAQQGINPAFPNPKRAEGGFGSALDDPTVRIDFQQHAMSALILTYLAEGGK